MTDSTYANDAAPKYTIRTLTDFLKVPEDRRAECLKEFSVWLELYEAVHVLFDGLLLKDHDAFVWIDDGKSTATIRVESEDGEEIWRAEGKIKP